MTVRKEQAEFDDIPTLIDIDYKWTDIVLRRKIADVAKAPKDQSMTLAVRCIGVIDGAECPSMDKEISIKLTNDEILALNTTVKTKIKAFVAVCEKGCARDGGTHTDDFSLAKG